jgi:hypothetical protein
MIDQLEFDSGEKNQNYQARSLHFLQAESNGWFSLSLCVPEFRSCFDTDSSAWNCKSKGEIME